MPFRTSRLNLGDLTTEDEPDPVRKRVGTMDALSITSAVLSINKKCCSTASTLHEIRTKLKDAPSTIASICSQTTVISASLSHLQYLILKKEDLTTVLERRPDLASALDCSMIGCVMLFSCLDDEIARVMKVAQSGNFNWRGKARMLWNQETLKNMLEDLRSQQAALGTLISLLQVDSMSDMKSILEKNKATFEATVRRTSTLRKSNPNVKVRKSIYAKDEQPTQDSFSIAPSSPGSASSPSKTSEFQFDFEDLVKNSRVYQQMLTKDKLTENERPPAAVEGDLIDLSDEKTIDNELLQESNDATLRQMQELVIAEDEEEPSSGDDNRPSITPRSPPRLELPDDFSGSFDLERASEPDDKEHAPGLPVSRFAFDNDEPDDEDFELHDEAASPTNNILSSEKQVKTLSKYDPIIFDAPIPAHEMPDFDLAVTPATPIANVEMQHEPEAEPNETNRRSDLISPSPEPEIRSNQTSPTPSGSFYSTSTSPDLRRHTSSLEVDFSKSASPIPDVPDMPGSISYIDRGFQRTPSFPQELSRSQQTSPTSSTATQKSPSPDARRKTSTLEVDQSAKPGSREKQKILDAWTFYSRPSAHHDRSSTSPADYRKDQTSPVPNASYYGRQAPTPSDEVYPRPHLDRNPSSVDTQGSHDSSASHQPRTTGSNTLRKAFFKRKPSTAQHCYRCKGSITGTFITAMGVAFHNGCFRCADCSRMLDSTAFPYKQTLQDGSQETIPLCEIDYFQRLDPICRACGNPLCGSFMDAFEGSRKDHLEAFSCGQCEKVFKAPYSYFKNPRDGRVYC